jgi:preprotein translocase subunit SecG
LILVVLLQSGKDAGLSGAFGLGGGGQSLFGARAGDVLSKVTVVIAVTFICTCLVFTRLQPGGGRSVVSDIISQQEEKQETGAGGEQQAAGAAKPPVAVEVQKEETAGSAPAGEQK